MLVNVMVHYSGSLCPPYRLQLGSVLCRFNFGRLGFWFPWSVVLLVVAAALFAYVAVVMVRRHNNLAEPLEPP